MKVTQSLISSLVVCGITLAMVCTAAAETKEYAAKVVRTKGDVSYSPGNGSWQPLKVGTILHAGTQIKTGPGAVADFVLGDVAAATTVAAPMRANAGATISFQPTTGFNTLRVFESSEVNIDKLVATETGTDIVTETQLDLKKGHIIGNVKKMSAASKYEVKLPKGMAGIRGTIYDITDDGVVRVAQGSVVISYEEGGVVKTVTITSGYSFDTNNPAAAPAILPTEVVREILGQATVGGGVPTPTGATEYLRNDTVWSLSPTEGL